MSQLTTYVCLECRHYTISKYDGIRCAECSGITEPIGNATYIDKSKLLSIDVNIRDIDKVKEILDIVSQLMSDKRVPQEVKQEFKEKMLSIIETKS
jgi:hypothetical protein